MCLKYDERFDEIGQACVTLNRYGVQARYPNEIEILETDMVKALEHARQIKAFEPLAIVRDEVNGDKSLLNKNSAGT